MDQINSFEGGLNTDSAPERQEKNTYRYLLNGVDTSDKGELLKVTSEKGTTVFSGLLIEEGWKVIGDTQINNDLVFLLVKGTKGQPGYDCIVGTVDYNGVFTAVVNDPLLGFNLDWPIQATARITFNNHRIVYFVDHNNPDRIVDLDSTEPFNISEASLNSNTSLPIVNFIKMNDGNAGQLYTGVYQFVARYLNDDLSSSTFGLHSNPIPVIDDLKAVGRDGYDGAAPDTLVNNKTIQLQLTNLDPNKSIIEILAIRYVGLGLTAEVKRFYRGNYSGTTLDVEFTGLEETTDIALEEVIVEPVSYISSKTITQKDNRLIRANLKAREDAAFQLIANNIALTYDVEEEVYDQDNQQYFDDYKGEKQTFDKKTFMSEEVYAFSMQVVYTDGTKSLAYHIPAINPDITWKSADDYTVTLPVGYNPTTTVLGQKWYPLDFNTQTNGIGNKSDLKLGTYISQLKYEPNKDYPSTGISDGSGVFIRHHLMPPVDIEPHFRNVGDVQYIRYKAIKASIPDFSGLPADVLKDIAGYVILRADRDLNNRSVLAQGLIQKSVKMTSVDLGNDTTPYPFGDEFYVEAPGFSNLTLITDGNPSGIPEPDAGFIAAHNFQPTGSNPTTHNWAIPSSAILNDLVTFYSPDFILGNVPLDPLNFKEKLLIRGNIEPVYFQYHTTGEASENNIDEHGIDLFCDYDENIAPRNLKYDTAGQYYYNSNPTQLQEQTYVVPYGLNNRKIYDHFNTPHYWIRVASGAPYQDTNYIDLNMKIDNGFTNDDLSSTITSTNITNTKALINLTKNVTQQYGPLGQLEYLPIAFIPNKDLIPSEFDGGGGKLRIFNGDIFISKFFVKNSALLEIQAFALNAGDTGGSNVRIKKNIDNFTPYKGMPIQSGSYFFVESVVNTNYRHQIPAAPPSIVTGVPYYPKFDAETSLHTDPKFGNSTGYNLAYSKNNNLKTVPERPFGFISVANYPNRIIYSQQAVESEQLDAYRIFLANNFHDIPKNKGEIWNVFNFNNILYAHTPKSLFRTYTNEATALTGSFDSSDIYVGNGGMFPRPSTEVLTLNGGYAGTISQFAGTATPSGYIFPDILQGKMFKLNQGLEEISTQGVQIFFNENLNYYIDPSTGKYIDNPFKPGSKGILATYDAYRKRYIMTNHDTDSFTLSYSFIVNKWRSFHSYTPHVYVSNDNRFFAIDNSKDTIKIYEHNVGNYLEFYENPKSNFEVSIVVSSQGLPNIPDNLSIKSICQDETLGRFIHQRTFNEIRAYNDKMNTDFIEIVTSNSNLTPIAKNQIKAVEKNDSYKLALPKNYVIDDSLNIFDSSNLVTSLPLSDARWLFRPRIKGDYSIIELIYNPENTENYKFSINFIQVANRNNTYN